MSSKLASLALAAGIVVPSYAAIDQIPVIGPPLVQAYVSLPPRAQQAVHLPLPLTAPAPSTPKLARVSPAETQATLDRLVADVVARHGGRAAVSVGGFTAGDKRPEPAFSTMKVPLGIAALRQNPAFYPDVEAAVTRSDNPAAHRLFGQVPSAAYTG